MSSLPAPRYSIWQAVSASLAAALRALEEVRALSRQPGEKGDPGERGERGADGFGFDNLAVVHDGERKFTLRFERGEDVKEFSFDLPVLLDRGVWKEGSYAKGDGVTHGGSLWIAQCDTTGRPEVSRDWRLAIKRGRDGKDGKPGEKGERGAKGDTGIDRR